MPNLALIFQKFRCCASQFGQQKQFEARFCPEISQNLGKILGNFLSHAQFPRFSAKKQRKTRKIDQELGKEARKLLGSAHGAGNPGVQVTVFIKKCPLHP